MWLLVNQEMDALCLSVHSFSHRDFLNIGGYSLTPVGGVPVRAWWTLAVVSVSMIRAGRAMGTQAVGLVCMTGAVSRPRPIGVLS